MLQRVSALLLICFTSFSSAFWYNDPGDEEVPDHLLDDDDDWGVMKFGFRYWDDAEDEEDQKYKTEEAEPDDLLEKTEWYFDETIGSFVHHGMKSMDQLLAHHSVEAYNKRKAERLAQEEALDQKITKELTPEQRDTLGIKQGVLTVEEMSELMTLMGHFKGMNLVAAWHHKKSSFNQDHDEEHDEEHNDVVDGAESLEQDSLQDATQVTNTSQGEADEAQEPALAKVAKSFAMGRAGKTVRSGDTPESEKEAAYKVQATTTTQLPTDQSIVRTQVDMAAQLNAVEPGKDVASEEELQRMKQELEGHSKVLKALQAGISSGVVQGISSSFSWEIVAGTAEWAANKSMEETSTKAKGAIFGAAQNDAVLLGLKSPGSIKMRVQKMMDREIRRNIKSQEHRVEADKIVQDTTDWIGEQIVAKQILNVTDLDLGMVMKAMVLGASRAMSRCSTCHDTAKATAIAAADITMQDVSKRIQEAKEVQENSKDFTALQAYTFAIIWGRNRADAMGIAEEDLDWDEVTELAREKAEEVRKANPTGRKGDPFKAAKIVVKDYLRKHARKSFDAFKKLAKDSAQKVRDESAL